LWPLLACVCYRCSIVLAILVLSSALSRYRTNSAHTYNIHSKQRIYCPSPSPCTRYCVLRVKVYGSHCNWLRRAAIVRPGMRKWMAQSLHDISVLSADQCTESSMHARLKVVWVLCIEVTRWLIVVAVMCVSW
jgi:hypothetical protein